MSGWGEIVTLVGEVWARVRQHRLVEESAKIAYYSFLSLFPLVLILFALAGFLGGDPAFEWTMLQMQSIMPGEAAEYLGQFVHDVTSVRRPDVLSVSLVFLLVAASSIVVSMINALSGIFGVKRRRSWWRKNLLAIGLVLLGTFLLAVPWVFMGPAVLERLGLGWIWPRLHWPLGFALLTWLVWRAYVTLPKHTDEPPRLLLAAGAVLGTGLWALVTVGFRLYLANFDRFTSLYGVVTGIIVLMVWLHSSAFSVLLGAEVASTLIDRLDSSEEGSTEADEATDS